MNILSCQKLILKEIVIDYKTYIKDFAIENVLNINSLR